MADLFKDIIPSILQTKKNVLVDDLDVKDYTPFIVNRALSYHIDCILYANEVNLHPELDKDMQYHYLLNSVRGMKRKFQPWQKSSKDADIDCVKTFFGYSNNKAKEALTLLSEKQLDHIRKTVDIGGLKKK